MAILAGTISGTGATGAIAGTKFSIKMDFSGTASVDIEEQMPSGNWIKAVTAITADYVQVYDRPTLTTLRLNCTAFTNSVEYIVETN
ncbi:MAG: hypothetical protein E5X94_00660 [Mesorhizobium sp.]|uniref:hypothetical protein n=1 Tax=unclassified Mesorhizobium TaxID=325217 RepID=UPI000FCCB27C|nr:MULTISPECIES: hypothetical protein [unclassified Mesorhizobium]RUW04040.1 hypothetical protein EOA49_00490 [Mesorhizobium sp. M1A.F.Ca.IN.020.04.1.1]RUW04103.1 hypothetical protein EOA49_00825 [Mesorhizobium sp. M1A.F.Ca.IN.020.04.1.1]TIN82761.1 MAG: hypothetical protein E5X97_29085 [Mesorhizobium sp.]TIN88349.1 MAG: hypothetical protein E5X94_00660 [Mesorhizobium sp.]TIO88389.1 MAG: hypothetical protein E5Y00_05410 [Mesorhizobium sp.]